MVQYKMMKNLEGKSGRPRMNADGKSGVIVFLTSDGGAFSVSLPRNALERLQRQLTQALDACEPPSRRG